MKEQFLELLKKVKREGINELIEFIEKTDFYKAPLDFMEVMKEDL